MITNGCEAQVNLEKCSTIKRGSDGEPVKKRPFSGYEADVEMSIEQKSLKDQNKGLGKKTKSGNISREEKTTGIQELVGKYDVILSLAKANNGITFGHLIREDTKEVQRKLNSIIREVRQRRRTNIPYSRINKTDHIEEVGRN